MASTHRAAFVGGRPWAEAEFADLLRQSNCFAIGDVRCFALIRAVLDEAELLTIATRPDCQRQGLARTCMAEWPAKAHLLGASRAFLEVAEDNSAAIALYRACGFESLSVRPRYYRRKEQPPVDALIMSRALP